MQAGQVVSLVIVVAFIFGAFYLRHYILRRMSGHGSVGARNKNIAIVDRFAISRDKSFVLVEIAGKVYVVAMTNQSATLLDTLDAAAFSEAAAASRERNTPAKNVVIAKGPKGNSLYARMTRSLTRFLAARMGKTIVFEDESPPAGSEFAKTMNASRKKDSTADSSEAGEDISNDSEDGN